MNININTILDCDINNKKNLEEIQSFCAKGTIIPFIGAGLSRPIYPDWNSTLKQLLEGEPSYATESLEKLLAEHKYEEAADYISDYWGKGNFETKFYDIFSADKLKGKVLSKNLLELVNLFSGTIVTTNFDKCLETAYSKQDNMFSSVIMPRDAETLDYYLSQINRNNPHYLWKIHGDIDNFNLRVFTTEEYDSIYNSDSTQKIFHSFFASNTLLFIGCSLLGSDRYLNIISELGQKSKIKNYAILQRPVDDEEFFALKRELSNKWIFPVWYPSEDSEHKSVHLIIHELSKRINSSNILNQIDATFKKNIISDKLETHMSERGIKVDFPVNETTTINDLVALCLAKSSKYSKEGIYFELMDYLGKIYDEKYISLEPESDVRGKSDDWYIWFNKSISHINISNSTILVVGVGNGSEGKYLNYDEICKNGKLILTDIAPQSLSLAGEKYKEAICLNQPAQSLSRIASSSVDVYVSLKVYQSTYFDINEALYEATRVLKPNGLLIISIANGFISNGEYIQGLLDDELRTIDSDKPYRYIARIETTLKKLRYTNISVHNCMSEIFIQATCV